MLQPFLESLPAQTPLSVDGVGPIWLYAALAAHGDQQPFYLFDPKIGWIQPARVYLGTEQSTDICIKPETRSDQDFTVLKITFPRDRIGYFQPDPLAFPPISPEQGLIIDGRVPNWLLTALVRLYKAAGVPWIAPFYVPLNKAIVAYSRIERYQPGDLISVFN
jgi:CRISPR-associated protein Csx3